MGLEIITSDHEEKYRVDNRHFNKKIKCQISKSTTIRKPSYKAKSFPELVCC